MSSGASNFVESVDSAFLFIVVISLALLVLVTALMIAFVIKYNKKRHPKAVNIHGNLPLEVAWTLIPTLLVLAMFWFGWVGYKQMSTMPENAYEIDVTAQMWQWKFHYNTGAITDTLYVPFKTPVKLNLKSLDVNHAIFIPAFRLKKDVYASRENQIWFEAEKEGSYDIACAEYCGMRHSYMYTKLVVLPVNKFNLWLKNVSKQAAPPVDTTSTTGAKSASDTTRTNEPGGNEDTRLRPGANPNSNTQDTSGNKR